MKEMNVVRCSADDERVASKVCEDASEIRMEFGAKGQIAEKRLAVTRREDGMEKNICQGLWHYRDWAEGRVNSTLSGLIFVRAFQGRRWRVNPSL